MLRNFRFLTLFSMYRCNNFIVGTSDVGFELECVWLSVLPSFFALKSGVRGPCDVKHDIDILKRKKNSPKIWKTG